MGTLPSWVLTRFQSIEGPRFHWKQLFDDPEPIWRILKPDQEFDPAWHRALVGTRITEELSNLNTTPEHMERLKQWN